MKPPAPALVSPAEFSGGSRFAPADLWRMFKERWLIGLAVGLVAAGIIAYFVLTAPPVYHTEASLLFSEKKDRVINIPEVVDTTLQTAGELNMHIEQLKSKAFFEYLLASFTPEENKRIQAAYTDGTEAPPSVGAIIRPNTSIFVRKGTNILGISVNHRDPEVAAMIADRYAHKYIEFNLDRATTGTNSAIIFLRNAAEDMRRQVEAAETAQQDYRSKHNMAALNGNQNVIQQKITSLGATLVHAQMDQIELQTVLDHIDEFKKAKRPLIDLPEIQSVPQVAAAKNLLDDLRSKRAILEERYLAKHPKMKENETQMREAQRMMDEGIARAVADFKTRHDAAAQYEQQLREDLKATEAQARELDKISIDYKFLDQDVETKRMAYMKITDRLNEASITSQLEDVNIRLFDRAWVAGLPIDDPVLNTSLFAGGALLFLLFTVPLGIGFFDTRIKTTAQVERALGEKLLGVLQRIKKATPAERAQAFLHDKDGALTESSRGIYGEIEIASTLAYPKSLLITSSVPNEGKSLIASNLAAVFSSHGRRTLLVDCDLRRASLHKYFQVDGKQGWIQWLQIPFGDRPPLPAGIVNLAPRLDLLPAGPVPSHCTQLLEQLAHAGVQKQLLSAYDLVIFDTPPVTIFPDALLLARACHELVYVCLFSRVRLNTVRRAIEHLKSTGVHSLGVILNQMPPTAAVEGYYGYGSKASQYYKSYAKRPAA